jgi:3-deoxy-D-manno-octulosonic-acid transferase
MPGLASDETMIAPAAAAKNIKNAADANTNPHIGSGMSPMRWFLNLIYAALLTALSPVILWRMLRHGRYRRGLAAKLLGNIPVNHDGRPVAWFHAVSVGEVVQLQKVVDDFQRQSANHNLVVVSTSTDTGFDLAQQRFPNCQVVWFPLDFSWAVRRAILSIRPKILVLMELELWPSLLLECRNRQIPVAIINARLSERSFNRYLKVRRLLEPMFKAVSLASAQSHACAQRLQMLGVPATKIHVTGSVKFDGIECRTDNPKTQLLRKLFQLDPAAPVLMAGSTQPPEEHILLDAFRKLRQQHPTLQLILVPRHRERFDEVAALVSATGLPLLRRSTAAETAPVTHDCVRLLDTIGELSACWGLADIAFVGGSFGNRGGQNMIEPAAWGAAVTFGPNTWNFRDVVQIFRDSQTCSQVNSPDELLPLFQQWLNHPDERRQIGTAAAAVVRQHQGATAATTNLLLPLISPMSAQNQSPIPRAA